MPRRRSKHERPEYRLMFRVFDADEMQEVRDFATAQRCTLAEAVRILVTWGLETNKGTLDVTQLRPPS